MISYLLASGKTGTIRDPRVLREFYARIFHCLSAVQTKPHKYANQKKEERR